MTSVSLKNKDIVIKPAGITMNQFILDYKEKNQINKLCFAGRLDPMARGKVLLLFNDECKKIEKYKNMNKIYKFKIVIGFQTDSDDPLGIIQNINPNITPENIIEVKNKLLYNIETGPFKQSFHKYSSKCINGKPLWQITQENKNNENKTKACNDELDLPSHLVSIYDYKIGKCEQYNFIDWKNKIINQINTIDKKCNFNQENIINQWDNVNMDVNYIYAIPVTLTVSSGFYVRQFVRDFSNMIDFPLMVYDINRIEIFLK